MKQVEEQLFIINAPKSARIFVEAQPGTGKTAVACARVVRLISEEEVPPSSILMISFTRTAVAEMKNRIRQSVSIGEAMSINIATLDHTAFSFGIGCGQEFEKLMGAFDDNIELAIEQLKKRDTTLLEYLSRLAHVVIDEAQDITGPRADLASLLLKSLSNDTGVTVFADRAQAIYGFTTDVEGKTGSQQTVVDVFDFGNNGFQCLDLKEIHRTDDKQLLGLFGSTRKAALYRTDGSQKPVAVMEHIRNYGASQGDDIRQFPLKDGDLILYRKRAAALMSSQYCPDIFRLRLPGYPAAVFSWIGAMLWDWKKPRMNRSEFDAAWKQVPDYLCDGFDGERAWGLLIHFASAVKGNDLDLKRLCTIVSRPRPPVELCHLDFGGSGPIFSTIHASKGREADRVFLMIPANDREFSEENSENIDFEEEARVYYVGATRVRKEFFHGIASTLFGAGRLDKNGRRVVQNTFSLHDLPKFQFGLVDDINETAIISRHDELCATEEQAIRNQKGLLSLWQKAVSGGDPPVVSGSLKAVQMDGEKKYLYMFSAGMNSIAWSGNGLDRDLWTAANKHARNAKFGKLRPPDKIEHLRLIGLRTCAIHPGSALEGEVREPFASSGFFLAPMIVGFPSVFFVFQKKW